MAKYQGDKSTRSNQGDQTPYGSEGNIKNVAKSIEPGPEKSPTMGKKGLHIAKGKKGK